MKTLPFKSNHLNKPHPVVLNENNNWCFHEYQSTARTCVSYAEAGINTKLAEDLPIHSSFKSHHT